MISLLFAAAPADFALHKVRRRRAARFDTASRTDTTRGDKCSALRARMTKTAWVISSA